MKRYADRGRKETEEWKKGDRVLLSTKDLVFKERPSKKLTERYIGPYGIEEVVSSNAVKLRLPSSMRIHVMNIQTLIIFILFYFIFLILLFFFFYFPGKMMKKARDKEVT